MCCNNKKRRVKYQVWTADLYAVDAKEKTRPMKDWGFTFKVGWFVEYGLALHEVDSGTNSYSVAIIENDLGEVELVHPENIKFLPTGE